MVDGREVALEMLVDEEEIRELRVAQRHHDEPGRGQRQHEEGAAQQVNAAPDREVARQHRIDDQHDPGEYDADEPLGQHRDCHRGPRRPHPEAPSACRGRRMLCDQHACEHERHRGRHSHVERIEVTRQVPTRGRQEDKRRVKRGAAAEPAARGERRDQQRGSAAAAQPRAGPAIRRRRRRRMRAPSSRAGKAAFRST